MNIKEILSLPFEERKRLYEAKNIDKVIIDGNVFSDYGSFSYLNEKSYEKSPLRSAGGVIGNLDSYATFLTPHLKIDFSLMSIDSYRKLMKLLQSKNEFTVECYDVVNNTTVSNKMYFATESMPNLVTIARALSGGERYIELLGVKGYTVELIGTNNDVPTAKITYDFNLPAGIKEQIEPKIVEVDKPKNHTVKMGAEAVFTDSENVAMRIDKVELKSTDDRYVYKFSSWCETADGTGLKYIVDNEYMIANDTKLYAIWSKAEV